MTQKPESGIKDAARPHRYAPLIRAALLASIVVAFSLEGSRDAGAQNNLSVGPSFDCSRARDGVGATICSDAGLRRIDVEYVQAFYALRHQLGDQQREPLRQDALAFHQFVFQTCNLPRTVTPGQNLAAGVPCIANAYRNKRADYLKWLQGDALQEASRDVFQHVALQAKLVELGALPAGSAVDGIYGPATREAIARLQTANGLPPTGFLSNNMAGLLQSGSPQSASPKPSAAMPTFAPPTATATPTPSQQAAPTASPAQSTRAPTANTVRFFASDTPAQTYASDDASKEATCFSGWQQVMLVKEMKGELVTLDLQNDALITRRVCTAAAFCDLRDGKPNLMSLLSTREANFRTECRGVERYGPALMDKEPAAFAWRDGLP